MARTSWQRVACSEGVLSLPGSGYRMKLRAELAKIDPDPTIFTDPAKENRLREACRIHYARLHPNGTQHVLDESRDAITESARARFDKALTRARAALQSEFDQKHARLQADYERAVAQAVEARIAPQIEKERQRAEEKYNYGVEEAERAWRIKQSIKRVISKKELQLVLNCLHPDRAPEDRRDRYAQAFNIVNRLRDHAELFTE